MESFRRASQPRSSEIGEIADQMLGLIPESTEILAGLELGGVPIATALSLRTGLPVVFVRKRAKEYGTQRLSEGTAVEVPWPPQNRPWLRAEGRHRRNGVRLIGARKRAHLRRGSSGILVS